MTEYNPKVYAIAQKLPYYSHHTTVTHQELSQSYMEQSEQEARAFVRSKQAFCRQLVDTLPPPIILNAVEGKKFMYEAFFLTTEQLITALNDAYTQGRLDQPLQMVAPK